MRIFAPEESNRGSRSSRRSLYHYQVETTIIFCLKLFLRFFQWKRQNQIEKNSCRLCCSHYYFYIILRADENRLNLVGANFENENNKKLSLASNPLRLLLVRYFFRKKPSSPSYSISTFAIILFVKTRTNRKQYENTVLEPCGQSYKKITLVNYISKVVMVWAIFQSVPLQSHNLRA